jgi:diphthamide biosynthesis protein 2
LLGSCCVDEVAAQHVDAHAVVHYGRACMSKCVPLILYPPISSDVDIPQELSSSCHLRLW